MRLRGEVDGITGMRVRGRGGLTPRTVAVLAVTVLCVLTLLPATALAATADAYEPDDTYGAATVITVGAAPQQHTISPVGDQDWFAFSVSAGSTYVIETSGGDPVEGMDTVLYLYADDGTTELAYDDDSGDGTFSRLEYAAAADATVYVLARGFGDVTGTYAVGVTLDPMAVADAYEPDGSRLLATTILEGDAPQQHTIFPAGDEDWVSFAVSAGKTYAVEVLEGTAPDVLPIQLELYDSDGTTVLDYSGDYYYDEYYWGTGNAHIDYEADADKTIYARVAGQWFDETGVYTLALTVVSDAYEPDDTVGAARAITVGGGAQQHNIFPPYCDEDWASIAVVSGWKYTVQTSPGTTAEDLDLVLRLYDADGITEIDRSDVNGANSTELIEYTANADKTVYVRVTPYDDYATGTYALSVTAVPIARLEVVESEDFGDVAVGQTERRTLVVRNTGAAPLVISSAQLAEDGFSIVRDDVSGDPIPQGASREIEVEYAPSVAYTGAPAAVAHDWTSLVAEYNYSGATLVSIWLYSGFENVGGAGDLGWRVRIGAAEETGAGAVVAGGRYTVRVAVSAGTQWSTGLVELLQPVTDSWSFASYLGSLLGVVYLRVPDATLTFESNDDDEPTIDVGLFGVALPAGSTDTTPPTTSVSGADDLWHNADVTLTFTAVDDEGGSGMVGGQAKTEYRIDDGVWTTGTACTVLAPADHSWDGAHTVLYRSTDADGNTETAKSVTVRIDTTPPAGTFVLEGDAATTPTLAVSGASDVTEANGPVEMRFSVDDGTSWTPWGAYAASTELTLPPGAGTKTVVAQYRDVAGNMLELSDSIEVVPESPEPSLLELTAAATIVPYKGTTTLTVQLTDSVGTPLGGYLVDVQKSLDGLTWTTFATVESDGGTVLTPALTRAYKFRAIGQGDNSAIVSPTVIVKPRVYLGAPVAPLVIKKYVSFVVYGTLKPRHSPGWNKAVKLYCYRKNLLTGVWVLKKTVWCKTIDYSTYSRYRVSLTLPSTGKWKLRAYAPEDARHAATWSASTYRTVK